MTSLPPDLYDSWDFCENFFKGDQDFLEKIGGSRYSHLGVVCGEGRGGEFSIEKGVSTGFH